MTKRRPKIAAATKADSEFSFADYDHVANEDSDPFAIDDFDAYTETSHYQGEASRTFYDCEQKGFFARRCGSVERAISEDPFSTSYVDKFGPYFGDPFVPEDQQDIALARFEIAAAAYVRGVRDNSGDTEKRKILADIVAFWLRESRRCNELGIEVW